MNNKIRYVITILLEVGISCSAFTQYVSRAEYYIDTDPGMGNATVIAITQGQPIEVSAQIPTTALAAGMHWLGLRTYSHKNYWGHSYIHPFFVPESQTFVVNKMEYFWDTDPGMDNGTDLSFTTSGGAYLVNETLATAALSVGLHRLYVRAKADNGKWSNAYASLFHLTSSAKAQINTIRYFWDGRQENAAELSYDTEGGSAIIAASLPIDTLSDGTHYLYIQIATDKSTEIIEAYAVSIEQTATNSMQIGTTTISIYPMPFAEQLYIDGMTSNATVTITDMAGRVIQSEKMAASNAQCDTRSLQAGYYLLSVEQENGTKTMRLIVKK